MRGGMVTLNHLIGNPNPRSQATKLCASGQETSPRGTPTLSCSKNIVMERTGACAYPAGYVDVDLE